ncbi:MAG: glycoside hydrolase family 3 protein [Polyangiaceae bacterium]
MHRVLERGEAVGSRAVLFALAVVGLSCQGCGKDVGPDAATSGADAGGADAGLPEAAAMLDATRTDGDALAPADAPAESSPGALDGDTSAIEMRIQMLLSQMSIDEKIGQMVMTDYAKLASADDVSTYFLGALLASGDDAPAPNTPQAWQTLATSLRAKALTTRLQIPLLLGIDAVHGNAKVAGATVFPHGIALGAMRDAALVGQVAQAAGAEVLATGFDMTFGPDADVGQDERWGRTYESFGEDPALVSAQVTAMVSGYQQGPAGPTTLLACPKHFLGAGATSWGTGVMGGIDEGNATIGEAEMRSVHLAPFAAAVKAGALSIMVSYSAWQGTKMSASAKWLTDVLKGELGYRGLLLSDFDAIGQLGGSTQSQEAAAINAGLDMIMMSSGYAGFVSDVKALVAAGTIAPSRIDDAVTRILRAKLLGGLFGAAAPGASALPAVGSAAHRQIARQAVRESLVLLQNDQGLLPLSKAAHVVVAGPGASDVGVQSGGWTLGWQGVTETAASAIGGTTILAGMQGTASSPGLVTYSWDGSTVPAGTSVGVVVLYENPYAEYEGDTDDPSFSNTTTAQNPTGHVIYDGLASGIVAKMESAGVPLVLVLVTGRPVRIESYLPHFGAVVAAWLPGSEGEGVADVLYGDAKFAGKLPRSWPRDATVLPLSSLQTGADPLFAYGFGLTFP